MSLQTIEQTLAAAAEAEWARIKTAGIAIEQVIVKDAESAFSTLTAQLAPLAMQTISNLATAEFASLSGSEKTNLATTTVVDSAAQQGISIVATDATALIKNAFEAFATAAPTVVPAGLAGAATEVLNAGESAVEKAVDTAAADANKAV